MIMPKHRVLLVDDEVDFTRLLKTNIEETAGYEVRVVNDAAQALRTARQFRPDFIVLDVIMPGEGGGDIAAALERDPQLKHTPMMFLTAAIKRDELGAASGVIGGRVFMAKPVRVGDLIAHIERNLSSKS